MLFFGVVTKLGLLALSASHDKIGIKLNKQMKNERKSQMRH